MRRLAAWKCGPSPTWASPITTSVPSDFDASVARVFREERGQVIATLIRILGDFDLAEDALQEATVAAIEHWPHDGIPDKPGAWLLTAARRKAVPRSGSVRR